MIVELSGKQAHEIIREFADSEKYDKLANDGSMIFWRFIDSTERHIIFCCYQKRIDTLYQFLDESEEPKILKMVKQIGLINQYYFSKKHFFAYMRIGNKDKSLYDWTCCHSNTKENNSKFFEKLYLSNVATIQDEDFKLRQRFFFSLLLTMFYREAENINAFASKLKVKDIPKITSNGLSDYIQKSEKYYEELGKHNRPWYRKLFLEIIAYQYHDKSIS